MIKNNIEVIALIYKSKEYLKFITDELTSEYLKVPGWDVGVRIVFNDASEEILSLKDTLPIPYTIYNAENIDEFYLNRVYKAWNFAGITSKYDNICFVNSDMMFSPNWLANLLREYNEYTIPCSRLVECGRLRSGQYGIEKYFGDHPVNIKRNEWLSFVPTIAEKEVKPGGLFMPCIFNKTRFIQSGMYPPGNIFVEENRLIAGYPNDRPVFMSGDAFFFQHLNSKYGLKHITVFDSIVYHIQEGEKMAFR